MSRRSLPAADAAWLHMDRVTNPMVVNAVIWFDEPLDWERAKEVFRERMVDRFPALFPAHRRGTRAPGLRGRPGLRHRAAHAPPGASGAGRRGCAAGARQRPHHTAARPHAPALARVPDRRLRRRLRSAVSHPPLHRRRDRAGAGDAVAHGRAGRRGARRLAARALRRPRRRAAGAVAASRCRSSVSDPEGDGRDRSRGNRVAPASRPLARLAGAAVQDAGTLARLLTAPSDARTVLKAPLHGTRRVAWSTPFPLERVKAAGRRGHGTINDVLVAAVTGSLRSYLQERGDLPGEVHVMVPFNLRAMDQPVPRELGNDFALILLALPVGIEDAGGRMRDVKMRMDAIKHSHEGPISFGILSAIGMTPAQVENRLIGYFSEKASAVVTNVPGPRRPVYLAGSPVRGVLVWAPCSGGLGMTVSIFSYAGEVTVGFMTDIGLVPDPEPLVDAFDHELRELCRGTRNRAARQRTSPRTPRSRRQT